MGTDIMDKSLLVRPSATSEILLKRSKGLPELTNLIVPDCVGPSQQAVGESLCPERL